MTVQRQVARNLYAASYVKHTELPVDGTAVQRVSDVLLSWSCCR